MFKQTLACTVIVASLFVSPVFGSGGVEFTAEDEAKASTDRVSLSSAEYGTADEAKAMLIGAVAAIKADKAGAIAKFNFNDLQFRNRDLFVFCFNGEDGKFTAHEAMVTHDVRTLRDKTGKAFGEQMYLNPKEGQIVTVAYMSPLPGSTKQEPKRAYVTRIADQVCGVSFHRFNGPGQQPME